jgi:serine/threonine protein kinase
MQARFFLADVVLGLEELHERGVAWRDLKVNSFES